jgi:hypothetical protein
MCLLRTRAVCAGGVAQSFLALALFCAPLQDNDTKSSPRRPEIQGTAIEAGTLQAVSGATVLLSRNPAPGAIATGATLDTVVTGASGDFHFTPSEFGSYRVEVKKDGYVSSGGSFIKGPSTAASVSVTKDHPSREVRLILARPGTMTGYVVDDETREPIANLPVSIWQVFYWNGQKRLLPAGEAKTGADGRFLSKGLQPADYLAGIRPRVSGRDRLLTQFSKKDLEARDFDYEQSYWPGGRDLASAFPASVVSHGSVTVGQLRVRRVPLYRVRVAIHEGSCDPSEEVTIDISNDPYVLETLGTIPCSKDFLLRGFAPGPYRIESVIFSRSQENRLRGSLTFQVLDKNLDLSLPLVRGIDIDGTVVAADGAAKPPVQDMRVSIRPIGGLPDELPIAPDAQGRFRLVNAQVRDQRFSITGLPSNYYIKEVRYNGSVMADTVLRLNPGATVHSLEIIVDDKPATLTGKVTDRDKPVSDPYVVVMKWPANSSDSLWPVTGRSGDGDGGFQFVGLVPGDYRLFAVPANLKEKLEEPNVLNQLLGVAKDITLAPRDSRNVALELTELR